MEHSHISCSFDYTGFIKEVQGRWVDVSYFGEKIIISIAAVVSGVVDSSGMAVIFFLVITRSLRMTLSICDLLGKIAGWTTPSEANLCNRINWS